MESNFFRCLSAELGEFLGGARIQKIYSSIPTIHTFVLGTREGKRFLHFSHTRGKEHLFVSEDRFETPAEPDARTMALRKELLGRRLLGWHADWPERIMAWELTGSGFLVLDPARGVDIWTGLPEGFGREPDWPDPADMEKQPELWRAHPQMTPMLRKTVAAMDRDRQPIFLAAVARSSCGECFAYESEDGSQGHIGPLVWRLQETLRDGRRELVFESAMEAATHAGHRDVFPMVQDLVRAGDADRTEARSRIKRVRRNLRKLDQEEARLGEQLSRREEAELIKASLYRLDSSAHVRRVAVGDGQGGELSIVLDPSMSIADNMVRLFKRSARAERGLAMIRARRELLLEELSGLKDGTMRPRVSSGARKEKRTRPGQVGPGKYGPMQVTPFRTSGGFTALRGKNAKANHKLLQQAASPFDYWFHAEDGPGAHVILRRDHPGQEVDEASLHEAAALAGLKSWQAGGGRARVMMALVKHVRSFKGASPGQVHVDRVERSLTVDLDPGLEDRLRVE